MGLVNRGFDVPVQQVRQVSQTSEPQRGRLSVVCFLRGI